MKYVTITTWEVMDGADFVQAVGEAGDHAEVTTTATNGPEEVRVGRSVNAEEPEQDPKGA